MSPLPLLLVEVTLVFAIALLGARLASKARAAVRHLMLAGAFGVALLLPLATLVGPEIAVEITALPTRAVAPPTSGPVTTDPVDIIPLAVPVVAAPSIAEPVPLAMPSSVPPARAYNIAGISWLLLGWAGVAVLALVPVCVSLWRLRAIRRRGRPWPEGEARLARLAPPMRSRLPLVLLQDEIAAPLTDGLLRPVITLPASAATWREAHLANALLHELEHVRRHDWAVHLATRVVCALYWFHPLAWIAWRSLRLEAERACDDAVLAREDAATYAEQLLELARRLANRPAMPGLQMASNSDLASRIKAVLDHSRPRGRAGAKAMTGVAITSVTLVVLFAPLRLVGPLHASEVSVVIPLAAAAPLREVGPRQTPARAGPSTPAFAADAPLSYSGITITGGEDPHAYGPRIELCKQDGQWTGFIAEYTGLPADPPAARMQDLQLDERTGTLTFTAELIIGLEPLSGGYVPARRLHEFAGRIDTETLKGRRAVRSLTPGASGLTREDLVLKRDAATFAIANSCEQWRENWNRRPAIRTAASPQEFNSPRALVADILGLVRAALADESTRALDEVRRPITGLNHVQRHAQAVLDDPGNDAATLATNYIEVINALTNTADLAVNVASRPAVMGLSPQRLRELAERMREKSAALAAMLMPATPIRAGSTATPERNAARVALDIALVARDDTRFVTTTRHSWLHTELVTLERAARSVAGDDGTVPEATTLKLQLLSRSIQTTASQAEQIARRDNEPADERRKATELATSLRNIGGRLVGTYPAQGGQQVSFRVAGADVEQVRITGDNQYDRQVTWDSARYNGACDPEYCSEVRARNWWFKGKVIVEYRLRGDPALRSCHFYVNERQPGSQWVELLAPARGTAAPSAGNEAATQGRCLAAPAASPQADRP